MLLSHLDFLRRHAMQAVLTHRRFIAAASRRDLFFAPLPSPLVFCPFLAPSGASGVPELLRSAICSLKTKMTNQVDSRSDPMVLVYIDNNSQASGPIESFPDGRFESITQTGFPFAA
jgi:hypothetical protein